LTTGFTSNGGGSLDSAAPVEQRTIFVSHSHADRALASQLQRLVETVFSGIVKVFASSDRGPAGGIMPGGDEWYSQIEANLRKAEAVWVLATPASITRPWIYWEAGTGRATCPRGLVVVRVGLASNQILSPLSNFQSYDGLDTESVAELLNKVAHQVGMTLAPVLVDAPVKSWVEGASKHQPEQGDDEGAPNMTPERLDRLEAAISRLEAVAAFRPPQPLPRDVRRRHVPANFELAEMIPDDSTFAFGGDFRVLSVESLASLMEEWHPDTRIDALDVDHARGEVKVSGSQKGAAFTIRLPLTALRAEPIPENVSARTRGILRILLRIAEGSEESVDRGSKKKGAPSQ